MKNLLYKFFSDNKEFDEKDKKQIKEDIQKKYEKVAVTPKGNFKYPTGLEGLEKQGYPKDILDLLPRDILDSYCGTGNPFKGGTLSKGDSVFDFGCGSGIDSIVAGRLVGDSGSVVGGDISLPMLEKAEANSKLSCSDNLSFVHLTDTNLSFEDNTFNAIISNSVINLVPDKKETLEELYRCLKSGGQFLIVDQVFKGIKMKKHEDRVKSWFQ